MTLQSFYNQLSKLSISANLTKVYYYANGHRIDNPIIIERIENNPEDFEYMACVLFDGLMIIQLEI